MKDQITLEFDGYWLEAGVESIPSGNGIFCVYACIYYSGRQTVSINRLLYIGSTKNSHKTLNDKKLVTSWKEGLNPREKLCYTFAGLSNKISDKNLRNVEQMMVYHHRPIKNFKTAIERPKEKVLLITEGINELLDKRVEILE